MTEEINYFVCGYCSWTQMLNAPKEKPNDTPRKRGYCRFEPPRVFPMPQPKKTSLAALGTKPEMEMVPLMMRPVVEENEPMCGRYSPNPEAIKGLGLDKQVDCSCTEPGEECDGCK